MKVDYQIETKYLEFNKKLKSNNNFVIRDNKKYKEIYNLNYKIYLKCTIEELENNIFNYIIENKIISPHSYDALEFDEICDIFNKLYNRYAKDDIFTRKVVIRPKDYFDENMAACISMVSFIVNKNLLDMHIIIRSEIDSKFKNDICNLIKIYIYVYNKLSRNTEILKLGTIFINTVSYHKLL